MQLDATEQVKVIVAINRLSLEKKQVIVITEKEQQAMNNSTKNIEERKKSLENIQRLSEGKRRLCCDHITNVFGVLQKIFLAQILVFLL